MVPFDGRLNELLDHAAPGGEDPAAPADGALGAAVLAEDLGDVAGLEVPPGVVVDHEGRGVIAAAQARPPSESYG